MVTLRFKIERYMCFYCHSWPFILHLYLRKRVRSEDDVSEKVVTKLHYQLTDYLTQHDFITVDQSAYGKGHSTEMVIIQLLENANDGQLSGACFFDLQKIF